MNNYLDILENDDAITTAIQNGDLNRPFVVYIQEEDRLSWDHDPIIDYTKMPMTFEIGSSGQITMVGNNSLQYSKDNGSTWNTLNSSNPINVVSGDVVQFRGNTNSYNNSNHLSSTATINKVKGNIMSIYDKDNYSSLTTLSYPIGSLFYGMDKIIDAGELILPATTLVDNCYSQMFYDCHILTTAPQILPATTLTNYCYSYMFSGCWQLTNTPELPATTLANHCYSRMFYGCSALTTAPELPATTLVQFCYSNMFESCVHLTTAPELPATTLADSCYSQMFYGCSALTTAPQILPATTLADSCYNQMFDNCYELTTAPQILPATTLANGCYSNMFYNCRKLTTAPELPATTLATHCYMSMFSGCTKLNYVKCLATNISAYLCVSNWLYNVSYRGTFVKAGGMNVWPSGTSGIPSAWTIQDAV